MTYDRRRADTSTYWSSAIVATSARRPDAPQASDTRSTWEIIAAYLQSSDDSDEADLLATVQYRGGPEEFRAGLALLASSDSRERVAGADILAHLGWQDRTFLEESVDALLCALRDPDDEVVQSAILPWGRESPRVIEALLPFVEHPCADFRYASVHGLMPHDTPTVVDALIKLCRDADRNVRDWATFTLGSQFESDSPSLRTALHERLTDADPETRGEALRGLARRRNIGIVPDYGELPITQQLAYGIDRNSRNAKRSDGDSPVGTRLCRIAVMASALATRRGHAAGCNSGRIDSTSDEGRCRSRRRSGPDTRAEGFR
jgi:HEAT repeat protein